MSARAPSCPPSTRQSCAPSVAPSTSRTNARNRWPPITDHKVSSTISEISTIRPGLVLAARANPMAQRSATPIRLNVTSRSGIGMWSSSGTAGVERVGELVAAEPLPRLHLEHGAVLADEPPGAVTEAEEPDHVADPHGAGRWCRRPSRPERGVGRERREVGRPVDVRVSLALAGRLGLGERDRLQAARELGVLGKSDQQRGLQLARGGVDELGVGVAELVDHLLVRERHATAERGVRRSRATSARAPGDSSRRQALLHGLLDPRPRDALLGQACGRRRARRRRPSRGSRGRRPSRRRSRGAGRRPRRCSTRARRPRRCSPADRRGRRARGWPAGSVASCVRETTPLSVSPARSRYAAGTRRATGSAGVGGRYSPPGRGSFRSAGGRAVQDQDRVRRVEHLPGAVGQQLGSRPQRRPPRSSWSRRARGRRSARSASG